MSEDGEEDRNKGDGALEVAEAGCCLLEAFAVFGLFPLPVSLVPLTHH